MSESRSRHPRSVDVPGRHKRSRSLALCAGIVAAACLASLPGTPAGAVATAGTPEEIAQATTNPSIVFISSHLEFYVNTHDDVYGILGPYELNASCTGFYVSSNGYIATAGHCVDYDPGSGLASDAIGVPIQEAIDDGTFDEATAAQVYQAAIGTWTLEGAAGGSDPELSVTVSTPVGVSGEQAASSRGARVVEKVAFEDGDVALLKTEETGTPVLLLAEEGTTAVGTEVLAVGYPASEREAIDASVTATFKDGKINTKGTTGGLKIPVMEMSAALSPGMSGGPTIDLESRVVGVNSATLVDNNAFNFIAPSSLVREHLGRNNVKNELGPHDVAYRAGLKAYFAGQYDKAITQFDKALGLRPSNFYAQDFKKKANEQLAKMPAKKATPKASKAGGSSMPLLIGGGLLVIVVVAVAAVMISKKGKGAAPIAAATPSGFGPPPGGPGVAPPASPAPSAPPAAAPWGAPNAAPPAPQGTVPPPAMPGAVPPPAGTGFPPPTAVPPTTLVCSNCGAGLAPGAHFCSGCGQGTSA